MNCSSLQELHFCGPSIVEVDSSDLRVLISPHLEVLVVDQRLAFNDTVLKEIAKAPKLRKLSCSACYAVSDEGLHSLSTYNHLSELNISYCHLVSDAGVAALAESGTLCRLIARDIPNLTDKSLLEVSKYCTDLVELDVSGCWHVTNKSLYALQENLMHMRTEKNCDFCLTIGGTSINGELAVQFGLTTSCSVNLHNLCVASLNVDYNPSTEPVNFEEEESSLDVSASSEVADYRMERAYDWLEADDPAFFSDEFSEPEECYYTNQ